MCLTAGQVSDHIGAKILYPALHEDANATMIADKGYDSDEYRAALKAKGISPCIPPRKGRKAPASFCKRNTNNGIRSRTCSGGSRTGAASLPAMTAGQTSSWPQSQSLQLSYGGFNES